MESIQDFIQYEKKRIFIDIASRGCGSGCKYCYCVSATEKQNLISVSEADAICEDILQNLDDNSFKIISFCPNTEPFKSKESSRLVIYVIKRLVHKKVVFQISTKEFIEAWVLEELNKISSYKNQIFINISLPYFETEKVEPFAGTRNERINNIRNIKAFENLTSCLYIKPYSAYVEKNKEKYMQLVKDEKPDFVCIGMKFEGNSELNDTCRSVYNSEKAKKVLENNEVKKILELKMNMEKSGAKVFISSTCIIANHVTNECEQELYKYNYLLCRSCALKGGM